MAYIAREIKDRIAIGDDCFIIEQIGDGRVRLTPSPDSVVEPGTAINKALLQLMEDRLVFLLNRTYNDISANPFNITFENLDNLSVVGVWNETLGRIEC
jgi:hypothetical protein